MAPPRYLDPEVLAGLGNCALAARTVCEGVIGGAHASLHSGYNAEFSHHREYIPGDDPRHIDWKRYGRTKKLYIRQYEENASLNAVILLDDSASMHFASSAVQKSEYARMLTAALSYLLLSQRDGAGLSLFSDTVQTFLPPSSKKTRFGDVCKTLEAPSAKGGTSLCNMLDELLPRIRKRCMFILISDFLEAESEILQAVARLSHARHEIMAFHVMAEEELEFPYRDFSRFEDLETGDWLELNARSAQKSYQENLAHFLREVRAALIEQGADYLLMNTRIPMELALTRFLHKRAGVL